MFGRNRGRLWYIFRVGMRDFCLVAWHVDGDSIGSEKMKSMLGWCKTRAEC